MHALDMKSWFRILKGNNFFTNGKGEIQAEKKLRI